MGGRVRVRGRGAQRVTSPLKRCTLCGGASGDRLAQPKTWEAERDHSRGVTTECHTCRASVCRYCCSSLGQTCIECGWYKGAKGKHGYVKGERATHGKGGRFSGVKWGKFDFIPFRGWLLYTF